MSAPRPASVLLVVDPDGRVLAGQRHPGLPFLGGSWAFPGGGVDADKDGKDGFKAAALRELREETGLRPGALGTEHPSLQEVVRWITPEWSPMRFDTRFFHVVAPRSVAQHDLASTAEAPELLQLGFYSAEELLDRWRSLKILLSPPTYLVLEAMTRVDPRDPRALAEALADTHDETQTYFQPLQGIHMVPLKTPTLPPATHTNAYIVGHERVIVVDPGTYEDEERQRLLRVLNRLRKPVEAVFLTHHHVDHVGSAAWLSELYGVPVWAHAETKTRVDVRVDRLFTDGDVIDLGLDARGVPFELELMHTPGHAAGHLCLRDLRPGSRGIICGDMVASIGTIIVDPDEGEMGTYIAQLERMEALGDTILLPSHGAPISDGPKKLRRYIDHRRGREARVMGALEQTGSGRAADLLAIAYEDTPRDLWPLAERSCLAHLLDLVRQGRATASGSPGNPEFAPTSIDS